LLCAMDIGIENWPPDYVTVSARRAWRLNQLRQNPDALRGAIKLYPDNPAEAA
jgi:hypothetical protein